MNTLHYTSERTISAPQLAQLFERSGINRPTTDIARMAQMLELADILATAWDDEKLVGVARSLTDFCYCCYLSDLAVDRDYQDSGIGRQLIQMTQEKIGPQTTLLLLAAPTAMDYYPKVGFEAVPNGWIIKRTQ